MRATNSLVSHQQKSASQMSLQDLHDEKGASSGHDSHFDHDEFLQQIFSSVPSSSSPWPDISDDGQHQPHNFDDQSTLLASKLWQHQVTGGAAKALMLQHQLLLSRGDENDDAANPANDISAIYNGFSGSLGQTSNQSHHFHHAQGGLMQAQSVGSPTMNQTMAASGAQPKQQKVRARRGQATDPHSIAERLRRERIAERMKSLQELVPNANKTDKASMLDEIIDYLKFLQLQVKVLSMSRLGGAAAVVPHPLVADMSSEGGRRGGEVVNGNGVMTEQQVAKLMDEDMGSAMQYLQGKGLCLMPISLASAISTATCHSMKTNNHPLLHHTTAPSSPSLSASTVQSATMGNGGT